MIRFFNDRIAARPVANCDAATVKGALIDHPHTRLIIYAIHGDNVRKVFDHLRQTFVGHTRQIYPSDDGMTSLSASRKFFGGVRTQFL